MPHLYRDTMSRKYPRIGRSFRPFKQSKTPPKTAKAIANAAKEAASRRCPCGAVATGKVEIQYNWFRGDDEEELRCNAHKDHAHVEERSESEITQHVNDWPRGRDGEYLP